ncbi:MAG TPA: FKBP-type peptidyl-prolyl cis-trans isomerase [Chryseosolibacter sp.]
MNPIIRVGANRVVALRYRMKNSAGETLVNTMESEPVKFVYGSGEILPALESALKGMKIGEQKNFTLPAAHGLDQPFSFDVVIDDICWIESEPATKGNDCGPGCAC